MSHADRAERDEIVRLRAENERYRLQLEHVPIGCILAGPDHTVLDWNPAAERIFGFARAEIVGRSVVPRLVPPERIAEAESDLATIGQSRQTRVGVQENLTKKGRRILVRWHTTALFDGEGEYAGHMAMCQDVTGEKALENPPRRSQEPDPVGPLARSVAHDFNNLLTAIGGYVDLARAARSSTEREELLGAARASIARATALAQQLLAQGRGGGR